LHLPDVNTRQYPSTELSEFSVPSIRWNLADEMTGSRWVEEFRWLKADADAGTTRLAAAVAADGVWNFTPSRKRASFNRRER